LETSTVSEPVTFAVNGRNLPDIASELFTVIPAKGLGCSEFWDRNGESYLLA